ncbi:MAG: PQQ-binding-like beta-propeller repeat protein [Thermomicrobiales bacterium]
MRWLARIVFVLILVLTGTGSFSAKGQEESAPVGPDLAVTLSNPLWCADAGEDPMQGMSMYLAGVLQPRTMLVAENIVVVPSQTNPLALLAFDLQTGNEIWTTDVGDSSSFNTGLLVAGVTASNQVIWILEGGPIGAVDLETGEIIWSVTIGGLKPFTPALDAHELYVVSDEAGVVSLDAASGAIRWAASGGETGPVMVVDDHTVVAALDGGEVLALDRETGQERWRQAIAPNAVNSSYGWGWTGSAADGVALFVAWDGETDLEGMTLHAVDTTTGDSLWSQQFGTLITAPVIANGRAFIGDGGGTVLALDLRTGAAIWHREVSSLDEGEWGFYGPEPVVAGATLVVPGFGGTPDGETYGVVFGFDAESGESEWVIATDQTQVVDTPAFLVQNIVIIRGMRPEEGGPVAVCAFQVPENE